MYVGRGVEFGIRYSNVIHHEMRFDVVIGGELDKMQLICETWPPEYQKY